MAFFLTTVFVILFLATSPKSIGRWLAKVDAARRFLEEAK
jgi:hypothetical protein